MRRVYNIVSNGVEVQNKNYQMTDITTGGFKAISDLTLPGSLDILLSHGNLRDEELQWRNISVLTNTMLNKMPKTSFIPFSMITVDSSVPLDSVLVSQGPGSKPIWKSKSLVIPDTEIFDVELDDAIILRGTTFVSSNFLNTTILLNQYISSNNSTIESIDFTNDYPWYSHRVKLNVLPVKCPITAIDDATVSVSISGNPATTTPHTFTVVDIFGNARDVKCLIYFFATGVYKMYLSDLGYNKTTDKEIYLSGITLKTSMSENITGSVKNYQVNGLESIVTSKEYALDVWGATSTMTTTIPYKSTVKVIDFNHHFGFLIKNDYLLYGFGTDTKGELNNKPTSKVIDVACGREHAVAILENGSLAVWGSNDYKQITNRPSGNFKKVKCSDYACAAITTTNELIIWGELGFDITKVQLSSLEVKDVVFGDKFMIIQTTDGKLKGYGDDTYGQLTNIPTKAVSKVSAGRFHACSVDTHGVLDVWGSDYHGQKTGYNNTLKYSDVSCGDYFSSAVVSDGRIFSWGNNSSNQVSNTPTGNTYTAVVAKSNNAIGFKDEKAIFTRVYKDNIESGNRLSFQVQFEHESIIMNDVNIQLTQLK